MYAVKTLYNLSFGTRRHRCKSYLGKTVICYCILLSLVFLCRRINWLIDWRGSRIGPAMVPLDRALLSCYRLSIVTIPLSIAVWPQLRPIQCKFWLGVTTVRSTLPLRPGNLSNTMLLGPHECPVLPNVISLRPTAFAGCTSVTDVYRDRRTDHAMVTRVTIGGIAFSDAV